MAAAPTVPVTSRLVMTQQQRAAGKESMKSVRPEAVSEELWVRGSGVQGAEPGERRGRTAEQGSIAPLTADGAKRLPGWS